MQLGMIGLGRMGGNIVRRLLRDGHTAVVFDQSPEAVAALVAEGAVGAASLEEFVQKLEVPRTAWVMLPAGEITEGTVAKLGGLMASDDVIIDGGNSFYKDDVRRAGELKPKGIHYVDVGTSGGVWGLERGYCMMIGGDASAVERLDPIFKTLAPGIGTIPKTPGRDGRDPRAEQGYIHAGPSGAGHFVKMVHNGIEYGLMQAYAEGFDILKHANAPELPEAQRFDLNMGDIAEVWRRGSVVSSWLLDLTAGALAGDENLTDFSGFVADSGEGRWTLNAAIEESVPANVLSAALYARFRSREDASYADKLLSAMRKGFGGHQEPKQGDGAMIPAMIPLPANSEVFPDADAVARAAADRLVALCARDSSAPVAVCLSGGSTPKRLYALLAGPDYVDALPWDRLHWFFGDERLVPWDDAASNVRMAREALAGAPIPEDRFHPMPTADGLEAGAAAYDRTLRAFYGADYLDPARPLFDLVLLGLGEDGHTASLFPGKPALAETKAWVAPVSEAGLEPFVPRLTLTFPALASARESLFLVTGAGKRETLRRLAAGDDLPAARVTSHGRLTWLVDRAAAAA